MHYKNVLRVCLPKYNYTAKPRAVHNVFDVINAAKLTYGKDRLIKSTGKSIGLNYGSKKVTRSGNSLRFQAIVDSSSKALRTTGFIRYPRNTLTTANSNTSFLTALTSTRKIALSS